MVTAARIADKDLVTVGGVRYEWNATLSAYWSVAGEPRVLQQEEVNADHPENLQHCDHIVHGRYPRQGGGYEGDTFFVAVYDANGIPMHKETGIGRARLEATLGDTWARLIVDDCGRRMPGYPEHYRELDKETLAAALLAPVRYELTDPRDGDIGVQWSFKTLAEMAAKADELGATKFQGVMADERIIQFVKRGGEWGPQTLADVIARGDRAAEARRLATELATHIQYAAETDLHDPETLPPELRKAYDEMGVDPAEDASQRAVRSIELRNIGFANAMVAAKHEKLDALPKGDIASRLDELRSPEPGVLTPEVTRQWATLDVREFRKIRDDHGQESAAINIAANAHASPMYGSILAEQFPDVAAIVVKLDAGAEQKMWAKEERKAAEFRMLAP